MALTFSFLADGQELCLPVPPLPFGWGAKNAVRELAVNGTGTIYLPGDPEAASRSLEFILPANSYPFNTPGTVLDPYYYIDTFETWIKQKKIVRYVVPGAVNARVVLEEVSYEERDGTGDVYCKLYLKESPSLEAVTSEASPSASGGRSDADITQQYQTYTVVPGDCLSVICRRYYGNGSAAYYNALAKYNGIKNPHLVHPGLVLTIPPKEQMGVTS